MYKTIDSKVAETVPFFIFTSPLLEVFRRGIVLVLTCTRRFAPKPWIADERDVFCDRRSSSRRELLDHQP